MQYLLSKSSAYNAQDKAVALISKKNFSSAMTEINKAIKAEPNEALFYATKGDIYSAQGKDSLAVKQYEKSVTLFPEQFSSYLKKGLSNEKLGNLEQAKQDFSRSAQLLPTSVAELGLGNIAQLQGDQRNAILHYGNASQAQGSNGQSARVKLAKLELPNLPEKYIKVKHSLGKNRALQAYAENHSEITVIGVEIESTVTDATGKVVNKARWKIKQAIKPRTRSEIEKDPVMASLPEGYRIHSKILSAEIVR